MQLIEVTLRLLRQMLAQGADEIYSAMTNATLNGHIEIVGVMLAQGGDEINSAMTYAALYGHLDIVLANAPARC